MKIKPVRAIVMTMALVSAAPAIAQEIQADGTANGVVMRKYSGEAAKPFFNAFVGMVREASQSSDPITRKGADEYLHRLESGQITGYIHETSRPVTAQELRTGIPPEDAKQPPQIPGQTSINQTCSRQGADSYMVIDQTYVSGYASTGTLEWQLQRAVTVIMSTCPTTAI